MAKILFTLNNSEWGIITNPVAGNVFRHTINFPKALNETLFFIERNKFINEQLFNEPAEHFETLFESIKDQSIKRINESQIKFSYDVSKDPLNRDYNKIVNSDYLILQEKDKNGNIRYEFYAVLAEGRTGTNEGTFEFAGELDIFLSFYITYRNQNIIKRKHTQRYRQTLTGHQYVQEENTIIESIDIIPSVKTQREKLVNFFKVSGGNEDSKSLIKWIVVYEKLNNNAGTIFTKGFTGVNNVDSDDQELNYKIFIAPIFHPSGTSTLRSMKFTYDGNEISNTYDNFKTDPQTISIQYLSIPPFNSDRIMSGIITDLSPNTYSCELKEETKFNTHLVYDSMKQAFFIKDLTYFEMENTDTPTIYNNPILTSYTEQRQILNEAKLSFSQFTKYYLQTRRSEQGEVYSEWTNVDGLGESFKNIKSTFSLQPDKFVELIYSIEENTFNGFHKIGAITADIIELPIGTDPYEEYLNQNRISSKSSVIGGVAKGGVALAGLVIPGGKAVKGISTALGVGGATSVVGEMSKRGDLKNQPIETKPVSNTFQLDFLSDDDYVYFEKNELEINEKVVIYDFLYKYGYEVNKLENISSIIGTRYYFNYVEAVDVFTNVVGKLSSGIKQLIDETFQAGITFWNYREKETWKGISNYEYENQEMSLIITPLKEKQTDEKNNNK